MAKSIFRNLQTCSLTPGTKTRVQSLTEELKRMRTESATASRRYSPVQLTLNNALEVHIAIGSVSELMIHSISWEETLIDFCSHPCTGLVESRQEVDSVVLGAVQLDNGEIGPVYVVSVNTVIPVESPLPTHLEVPSGKTVPLMLTAGLALDEFCCRIGTGTGVSAASDLDSCGSVAALVTKQGQCYMLTCEHVTAPLIEASEDSEVELSLPSAQARKRAIFATLGVTNDMNELFMKRKDPRLRELLGQHRVGENQDPLTLDQLHHFIYEDHCNIVVDVNKVVSLKDTSQILHLFDDSSSGVVVNGDIGLIPVSEDFAEANADNFTLTSIMPLKTVLARAARKKEVTNVRLYGAASNNRTLPDGNSQPYLATLAHLKEKLQKPYSSSTLTDTANKPRVLLGQLIVQGNGFGLPGDSGGAVCVEYLSARHKPQKHLIGVFVGCLSATERTWYVVSPAECLIEAGFQLYKKEFMDSSSSNDAGSN